VERVKTEFRVLNQIS